MRGSQGADGAQGGGRTAPVTQERIIPMDAGSFAYAIIDIQNAKFSSDRMNIVDNLLAQHYFRADQIVTIMKEMSFDSEKLKVAKDAYAKCVEPQNYQQVVNALSFASSRTELNNYINNNRR